jgi:actin-like ATPase involved in cell morphogenesis
LDSRRDFGSDFRENEGNCR